MYNPKFMTLSSFSIFFFSNQTNRNKENCSQKNEDYLTLTILYYFPSSVNRPTCSLYKIYNCIDIKFNTFLIMWFQI